MMTPRRDARQALLFRVGFKGRPTEASRRMKDLPAYELDDVIVALEAALAKNAAVACYKVSDGTLHNGAPTADHIQVRLEEIAKNQTAAGKLHSYTLRFSYLHPRAADRAKKHLGSGVRQFLTIGTDEAGEVGAHLVIKLKDTGGKHSGLCRSVLEQMPGLSRSKVIHLIDTIAEEYMPASRRKSFKYMKKVNGREQEFTDITKLKIADYAEKSESLEDDLKGGVLRRIIFLGEATETDSNLSLDGLAKLEQVIIGRVDSAHSSGSPAKKLIQAAMKTAASLGLQAKVDIDTYEQGQKKPKTRELDLDKEGIADQLFARQVPLHPKAAVPESYSAINGDIQDELLRVVDDKDLWV